MNALEIVLASLLYSAFGAVCGRLVAGHLAWKRTEGLTEYDYDLRKYVEVERSPTGEEWFWAGCVGLLVAVIWPMVVAMRALPSTRWAVGAEARAVARHRDRRIAELEKELELQ